MRLGWLRPSGAAIGELQAKGIPAALAALGWVEGSNLHIERRWADGRAERLPQLAAELLQQRCDVILTVGASATAAVKQATQQANVDTPIVMFGNFDPLQRGLVASLARPGGNLTGVVIAPDGTLAAKRLELLSQAVPRARRAGFLAPDDPAFQTQLEETRAAAASLGLELPVATVRGEDYTRAFASLSAAGAQALMVGAHTYFMNDRARIIELAVRQRWPSSWEWAEQVRDGGFMSYGTSLSGVYSRVASTIDRLLKGARAAETPVERPATFDLVLNLKTAKAIGLDVPRTLLLLAAEVVQ